MKTTLSRLLRLILLCLGLGAWTVGAGAQSGPVHIQLSGPDGKPSTLVYSVDAGWRLQAGWSGEARAEGVRSIKAVAKEPAGRAMLERPLTVFVDGPTGFTYIYLFDQGWKFVGRIADADTH